MGFQGIPLWFLYFPPPVRLLQVSPQALLSHKNSPNIFLLVFKQVLNASVNFPIYYFMGTAFRNTCRNLFGCSKPQ